MHAIDKRFGDRPIPKELLGADIAGRQFWIERLDLRHQLARPVNIAARHPRGDTIDQRAPGLIGKRPRHGKKLVMPAEHIERGDALLYNPHR